MFLTIFAFCAAHGTRVAKSLRRTLSHSEKIMKTNKIIVSAAVMALSAACFGQSKSFTLGKWVEIQNAILRELNANYVDSLPVARIERAGIDAMLENLDPYTMYIPEEEQDDLEMMLNNTYGGIGAVIFKPDVNGNVIINEPYEGSPASRYGLVCGDEILEIDGVSVHGLTSQQSSDRMKGKPGTTVTFKVKKVRGGESWKAGDVIEVPVVRERIKLPSVEYAGMLDDTTGYILQTKFTEGVGKDVKAAYLRLKDQGMKKVVLDLRGNGGGVLGEAVNIVSLFVPKGSLVVTSRGGGYEQEYKTLSEPVDTLIPIVVLVDSGSASSSEIVCGALQDMDRATVIGTRTYGKGLVQSIRPLPYDGQLKVTTAKYYTPSGRCVQAIDYSRRNEDGSVSFIPDSLTREFRTAHGRIVKDGGGITPDYEVKSHRYSRITYSLVVSGIVEEYVLDYVRRHDSIPALDDFRFTDEEFEDFIAFAKTREFDYRSGAKTLYDQMKSELENDGLAEAMKEQLDAMGKALEMDKETFLRLKKDEIIPFIEEEIAVRYYFQEAGIKIRLRYDDQLKEALSKPALTF